MPLLEASSAIEAANALAERLPESLSASSRTLFKALVAAAVETAKAKRYSPATTHVTMHLPLEVLAHVCGMHRVTAWRHLPALRELGVLDYRAHKGTLRGQTKNTGMLFEVRLDPSKGSRARLSYDSLRFKWRDLQRDVFAKKTAYRQLKDQMQQSDRNPLELDIKPLLKWVIPETHKTPVTSDSCMAGKDALYALLDVKNAPKEKRNKVVELAGEAVAMALADSNSVSFYQLLLWQLLRGYDQGKDYFQTVFFAAQRSLVDSQEGFARKSGALLIARLKEAGLFDEIMGFPRLRVGMPLA